MKKTFTILLIAALACAACSKEKLDLGQKTDERGSLSFRLKPVGEFIQTSPSSSQAQTKAADVSDFTLAIKNAEGTTVASYERFADAPSAIALDKGNYTLEARSPGTKPAAFDQPVYAGSQSFTIEPSKLSSVEVNCKLSNMKVEVTYTDAFLAEVTDFVVVVSISQQDDGFLTFTRETKAAGYFDVAPLTIQVQGRRVLDGSEINQTARIEEVAAQDFHSIRLNAVETGNLQAGIQIDYSTNDKHVEIEIPGEDEEEPTPGPTPGPDPDDQNKPTISGQGFDAPLVLTDAQADAGPTVDITVATPGSTIAELWVETDSPELDEELLGAMGLYGPFDMANLTPGSAAETYLSDLGLIDKNDPIKGKASFTFSIGTFMQFLMAGDTGSLDHEFHIRVKNAAGAEQSATLTVRRTH